MALTPENTARLQALQAKVLQGTATLDEVKEGVKILRQDRIAAQSSSTASRTKAGAERKVIDPSAILADLMKAKQNLTSGPVA